MDNKKLAAQFEKSLIKNGRLEQGSTADSLFSAALNVVGDGYINKACQHMERLNEVIESPIEEAMLYSLIISAQEEVEDIGFVVGGYAFGDCGVGAEFLVIEPQAKIENYRADFLLTFKSLIPGFEGERQLIVECDGHDYHDKTKQQASRDKERDREMKKLGYEVFRFTGSDIWNDAYSCAKEAIDMVTGITDKKRERKDTKKKQRELVSQTKKQVDIQSSLQRFVEKISDSMGKQSLISGVQTGFTDLDKIISGLNKSDLIVLASRPSVGKTTLALNISDHVAQTSGKYVLYFSLGMTDGRITNRLLSSNSMVRVDAINSGMMSDEEWTRLSGAVGKLIQSKMLLVTDAGLSVDDILNHANLAAKDHDLGLVVVDYLQLLKTSNLTGNRRDEYAEATRALKELAKNLDVPVVVLSQLNKNLERRADKRPVNSDLPDFGSMEQDADVIMFIYRDEIYHDDSLDKGVAEIIIGKQRNGHLGKARLNFAGEYSRFDEYTGPSIQDDY